MQNNVWGNKVRYFLYVLEGGRLTLEAYISEFAWANDLRLVPMDSAWENIIFISS